MKAKRIIGQRKWQTICLYSISGDGKTSLAATAPKPIFADANKGTLAIAGRKRLEHVRHVDIDKFADLEAVYDNCINVGDEEWQGRFTTLNIDQFDDMQNIVLDELVEKAMADDDRRDDTVEQREWGVMFQKLRRYVRKFKAVPMHKILICGAKEDHDSGQLRPSLAGQMSSWLLHNVDHTMYLRRNAKGVRYIHLDPTEEFYAKTRASSLKPEQRKIRVDFDNPHQMADIIELLAGPTMKKSKRDK